jgi:putative transposase
MSVRPIAGWRTFSTASPPPARMAVGGRLFGDLFTAACRALGVTQSMGRVGSALDDAAAESWNSTLEHELLSRHRFTTKDQARHAAAQFIDAYNHRRRHSSCEMLQPVAYEAVLAERAAETAPRPEAA